MNSILSTQHRQYTNHKEAILATITTPEMLEPEVEGLVFLALDERNTLIAQRSLLETTRLFRQFISYFPIINSKGEVFVYYRKRGGAEEGLHDLYSIGVGGHTDGVTTKFKDNGAIDLHATLHNEALRELKEEIGVDLDKEGYIDVPLIGRFLLSNANDVDQVHLGFVSFIYTDHDITSNEKNIIDAKGFYSLDDLKQFNLESWSSILANSEELRLACSLAKEVLAK